MTIEELKSAGATEYIVEGPNSEGVVGFYLLNNQVYHFRFDYYTETIGAPVMLQNFIQGHLNDSRPRYRDLAMQLQSNLSQ